MKRTNFVLALFFILVGINLFSEYTFWQNGIYFSKPLLLTTLSIYFYLKTKDNFGVFSRYILLGLIFSIGGDTLLMFVEDDPEKAHFFLLGLSSFLITHVFYFLAFWKYPNFKNGYLFQNKWLIAIFLAFLIGYTAFLWSGIPAAMKIPVSAYSLVIVCMAAASLNMKGRIANETFKILFFGVLFFVISDSLIGLNKFKSDEFTIPLVRILIMTTYLAGQYLIVKGSIKANS